MSWEKGWESSTILWGYEVSDSSWIRVITRKSKGEFTAIQVKGVFSSHHFGHHDVRYYLFSRLEFRSPWTWKDITRHVSHKWLLNRRSLTDEKNQHWSRGCFSESFDQMSRLRGVLKDLLRTKRQNEGQINHAWRAWCLHESRPLRRQWS